MKLIKTIIKTPAYVVLIIVLVLLIIVLYGGMYVASEKICIQKANTCRSYNDTQKTLDCFDDMKQSRAYKFANFNTDILFWIAGMKYG